MVQDIREPEKNQFNTKISYSISEVIISLLKNSMIFRRELDCIPKHLKSL